MTRNRYGYSARSRGVLLRTGIDGGARFGTRKVGPSTARGPSFACRCALWDTDAVAKKRLCPQCRKRPPKHWRKSWRKYGSDRDHELCEACYQAVLDQRHAYMRANRIGPYADEGGSE